MAKNIIRISLSKTSQRTRVEKEYKTRKKQVQRLYERMQKRMKVLEKNDMANSPAYKDFMRFSQNRTKGQSRSSIDIAEIRTELKELSRIDKMKTSGYKKILGTMKKVASNMNIKYSTEKDLIASSKNYFKVFERANQYLNTVSGTSINYDSERVINSINTLVESEKIELFNQSLDLDLLVKEVSDLVIKEKRLDTVKKGDFKITAKSKGFKMF